MIKEVKMYTVICDCCGKDACAGTDYASWNESSYVEEIAVEDGWLCDDEHHYCPECYEFDDEDNLVVKAAEPARTTTKEQSIIANVSGRSEQLCYITGCKNRGTHWVNDVTLLCDLHNK